MRKPSCASTPTSSRGKLCCGTYHLVASTTIHRNKAQMLTSSHYRQESSDEDEEGEVDDGIHYDPGRGVTYLDV